MSVRPPPSCPTGLDKLRVPYTGDRLQYIEAIRSKHSISSVLINLIQNQGLLRLIYYNEKNQNYLEFKKIV